MSNAVGETRFVGSAGGGRAGWPTLSTASKGGATPGAFKRCSGFSSAAACSASWTTGAWAQVHTLSAKASVRTGCGARRSASPIPSRAACAGARLLALLSGATASHGGCGPVIAQSTPLPGAAVSAETAALTARSGEHTSELQSPCNLVCRLLLAKKKHTADRVLNTMRMSESKVNVNFAMTENVKVISAPYSDVMSKIAHIDAANAKMNAHVNTLS